MKRKKISAWVEVPVAEKKVLKYGSIYVVLLDGRIPMLAQWRPTEKLDPPEGEWWTLGMGQATHIESKKKCVTHFLFKQTFNILE